MKNKSLFPILYSKFFDKADLQIKWHRVFFYLTMLLLPTQLGLHFWPEWAMVLGRKVDYLSPTLYLTDILIIITLLSWFWLSLEFRIKNRELRKKQSDHLTSFPIQYPLFFILFIFIIINIVYAANRPTAIYHWVKFGEFFLFAYYIYKTKPELSKIIFVSAVSVLYSSIIAITQFLLQHSIGGIFWFLGERTFAIDTPGIATVKFCQPFSFSCSQILRAYGTFPHPNVLGGFLAVMLPLILFNSLFVKQTDKVFRWINLASLVFGVMALFLTFSRTVWVALGIGLTIVIAQAVLSQKSILKQLNHESGIMNYVFRKRKLFLSLFLLFMIPASYFLLQRSERHFPADESIVVRNELNQAALKMFTHSPIFGVGLGNFLVRLPDYLVSRQIYFLQPVHNIYLLLLSEVGVIGIALLVLCIFYLLNSEYRIKNIGSPFIHYSLFTILFLGLFDHYSLTLQQGQLLFAVIAGLNWII